MSNASKPNPHQASPEGATAPEETPIQPRFALLFGVLLVVVAGVLGVIGILGRRSAETVLANRTQELAAPPVQAARATPGAPVNTLILPGNVTAFTDSPIYARTSGYLTHWYYDIGARVKKGALLAEISTPELDQQLAQAENDLVTAQAAANNARIQSERYTGLVKSNAVSQQDTDTFVNQAAATAAGVRSAQSNVQRFRELQSFEKVYAPFDGVITARTVDTGQLIDTGAAKELFRLQAIQTLRVYANLPQAYSQSVKRGMKIDIAFAEHAGKVYQGTLVTTADAIDPTSRTLLVEIDVDNRSGELLPGSLAQVHLKTPTTGATFVVPIAALIFRKEGMRVGTVVNGNVARLVPVTIGDDNGATVQIVSGLSSTDRVIQDPPDSLIDGEKVTVVNSGNSTGNSSGAGGK
jgi:RND family efflux transporter MFP subunit